MSESQAQWQLFPTPYLSSTHTHACSVYTRYLSNRLERERERGLRLVRGTIFPPQYTLRSVSIYAAAIHIGTVLSPSQRRMSLSLSVGGSGESARASLARDWREGSISRLPLVDARSISAHLRDCAITSALPLSLALSSPKWWTRTSLRTLVQFAWRTFGSSCRGSFTVFAYFEHVPRVTPMKTKQSHALLLFF